MTLVIEVYAKILYTGEYIDPEKPSLTFYFFTPRPLSRGDMYQMDNELTALLIEAHRNIGFLEGLVKYAPNKEAFAELVLLKECTYKDTLCGSDHSYSYKRQNADEEKVKKAVSLLIPNDGTITNEDAVNKILGILFPRTRTATGISYSIGRS